MFIARQPIFNRMLEVYGYELLFRSEHDSKAYDGTSDVQSTATIISGLFESGIEEYVEDKRAFVNFDATFLNMDLAELIEPNCLIVEVLETVIVDQNLIEQLENLKSKGYKIALDDFSESYNDYPLIPLADIIKFDMLSSPLDRIRSDVKQALNQGKIILAEKVETEAEFKMAKEMGFHLFQGYFFSKPDIIGKSGDKTTTKIQYFRLMTELKKIEPSYQILAEIIEKDIKLAYRLMRVISTRAGNDLVYSIKRALTYMGLKEIERWISIMMLRDLSEHKPQELMRLALVRTKFSELIATNGHMRKIKHEASMMGLFSTIDAMLDQSMSEALEGISLPKSVFDALTMNQGVLAPVYNVIHNYERGDWSSAELLGQHLGITEGELSMNYRDSLIWARDIVAMIYE
ncbi:MAG: EAL domain-containing protein [Bacillota bacterium]|nr:EAL domain-containing protein [Bacillota bacterium]